MKNLITRIETYLNRHLAYWLTNSNKQYRLEQYAPLSSQMQKGNNYLGRIERVINSEKNETKHLKALNKFYELSLKSCGRSYFVDEAIWKARFKLEPDYKPLNQKR